MNNQEKAFLAQIALGWFRIDAEGRIWRHFAFQGGGAPTLKQIKTTRAEKSVSATGGYLRVMFRDGEARVKISAHRIVWMVTNKRHIPDGLEINHKNGRKDDNRPENLEIVTHSRNMEHACRVIGRKAKAQRGAANAMAKITESQAAEIRRLGDLKTMPQREIASLFGISQNTVSSIVARKTWTHLP